MAPAASGVTAETIDNTAVLARPHIEPHPRLSHQGPVSSLGVDVCMLFVTVGAGLLSGQLRGAPTSSLVWAILFVGLALGLYASHGLYRQRLQPHLLDDVGQILVASVSAAAALVSLRLFVGDSVPAALDSLRLAAFASVYVATGRVALNRSQQHARSDGEALRPTLIVGAGRTGCAVARRLLSTPQFGLRPAAFLDSDPLVDTGRQLGIPVVGANSDLDDAIARYGIEQVIVAFSTAPEDVQLSLVRRCEELGVQVSIVPRLFERMPDASSIDHVGGIALVSPRRLDPGAWYFRLKYAIDPIVAGIALLILSPVLLALSLAILVKMGRPVLFRQTRLGRDGRLFEMLKFRSMRQQTDDRSLPLHTVSADVLGPGGVEGEDRRTRLGSFLRRSSLDELPQLINVLKGEMSLVGPRPERPEYVSEFRQVVYRYADRHRVKPGMTGWAQVHGLRGHTSVADRAEWDNFYIENYSIWLDIKIALMTVAAVFSAFCSVE